MQGEDKPYPAVPCGGGGKHYRNAGKTRTTPKPGHCAQLEVESGGTRKGTRAGWGSGDEGDLEVELKI